MTAEVAVMNRMGVALAADSAVTIGTSASKIYTSAEKLFQLSEVAPVGVMIYGNAGYVSLPWETIIKTFRRKLGKDTRQTVADYSDEFIAFLRGHPELFPDENRSAMLQTLVHSLLLQVRTKRKRLLDEKRKAKPKPGGPLTPAEVTSAMVDAIKEIQSIILDDAEVEGLDEPLREKVRTDMKACLPDLVDEVFHPTAIPPEASDPLFELAVEYVTRQSLKDYTSGIVIAGFGESEFMPALTSFEVEECVGHLPRKKPAEHIKIDGRSRDAFVMPFAQQDSVVQFLLGVDSEISKFMMTSVEQMTDAWVDEVLGKVGEVNPALADGLREPVKSVIDGKLAELAKAWRQQQSEYFLPVLETIAPLPKDELAAMAEAFVNLTKFRRRVTPVAETVSGPIDVAVITKGDGFVWIRRKHYFAPELNPRIMSRFYHPGEVK